MGNSTLPTDISRSILLQYPDVLHQDKVGDLEYVTHITHIMYKHIICDTHNKLHHMICYHIMCHTNMFYQDKVGDLEYGIT